MKIGYITIDTPLILAPMEDITDTPFRLICKRLGADIVYTEFTSSEALIRDARKALHKIVITDEERPIAIQIFGAREAAMEHAACIAESARPDFIDINCGCWVKNHAARGEGAGLLRDLKKFEDIVKATVRATTLPVTVKTRLGWDADSVVILEVARMVEQAGAQALILHCRTRNQAQKGHADWAWLEKVKKVISIPLIGNGDVKTPEDARRMLETGCDGVMIGRGAVSNPWIFQQTKEYLATGKITTNPSIDEKVNICLAHLELSVMHKGKLKGIVDFRKHFAGYFHSIPNVSKLRAELSQMKNVEEIADRLKQFTEEFSAISLA